MHYHVELWVPGRPSHDDATGLAEEIINELCAEEEGEDGETVGGRFDYGMVGGRWTGEHDGYNPEEDPKNQITCRSCKGTKEEWDTGLTARITGFIGNVLTGTYRGRPCRMCRGTGKETKFDLVPHKEDVMSVAILRKKKPDLTACGVAWIKDGEVHYEDIEDPSQMFKGGSVFQVLDDHKLRGGMLVTCDFHS
jgi:hypothetical protein